MKDIKLKVKMLHPPPTPPTRLRKVVYMPWGLVCFITDVAREKGLTFSGAVNHAVDQFKNGNFLGTKLPAVIRIDRTPKGKKGSPIENHYRAVMSELKIKLKERREKNE